MNKGIKVMTENGPMELVSAEDYKKVKRMLTEEMGISLRINYAIRMSFNDAVDLSIPKNQEYYLKMADKHFNLKTIYK